MIRSVPAVADGGLWGVRSSAVAMFFRFGAAMALVVAVSLTGTAIESRSLALRRAITHQRYQLDVLTEKQAHLRVAAQRAGAPAQWIDPLEQGRLQLLPPDSPQRKSQRTTPLLNWSPERSR